MATVGIDSSQEFSFNGQLTEKNGNSTLSGDATVSNTSTSSSSSTAGRRKDFSGGYNKRVVTNGDSSSLTKTASGSVTTKNGETKRGKQSLTKTTKNEVSVNTVVENRDRTNDNVTRYDRDTKNTTTITDTVTDGGDPKHTEENALDETIKTYDKSVSGSTIVIDTTDITRDDTTTYSLQGSQESLSIKNDKTTESKSEVTNGGYSMSGSLLAYGITWGISVSDYTTTTKTETNSSYSSDHTVDDEGRVSGGSLQSSGSDSTKLTIIGSGETSGQTDAGPIEPGEWTDKTNLDYESSTSNSYNESGSYFDLQIPFVGVTRVSTGTYWEESSSNSKTNEAKSVYKMTHPHVDEDITTEFDISKDQKRRIEGNYGIFGGTEKTTEDSRNTKIHTSRVFQTHQHIDDPDNLYGGDFDGKYSWEDIDHYESHSQLDQAPTGRWWTSDIWKYSGDFTTNNVDSTDYQSGDPFENATAPKQDNQRDTGGGGGVFSYNAGTAAKVAIDTIDPTGVIRGAANSLGTLALAAATAVVDPSIEQAYNDLGWFDKLAGFFFSDLGAQYDRNAALNRQQSANDGQLRAGARPTVPNLLNPSGGSAYGNTGDAAAVINQLGRDTTTAIVIEFTGVAIGAAFKYGKFGKVRNAPDVVEAAHRLGLDKVKIVNGVAELTIDYTLSISKADIDTIKNFLKSAGAKSARILTGQVINPELASKLKNKSRLLGGQINRLPDIQGLPSYEIIFDSL